MSTPSFFVGFMPIPFREMIVMHTRNGSLPRFETEKIGMHDLLIALAFVGMVFAPAIVAARVNTVDDAE